jgi:hypothetical protein
MLNVYLPFLPVFGQKKTVNGKNGKKSGKTVNGDDLGKY